jgi:hypothetical protein
MRLLDKNLVPHKLIAEIFDLEENDLISQLKAQQGTVVDPLYNKTRESVAQSEEIKKQIIEGKKDSDWVLPVPEKDKAKEKAKRPKPRDVHPEDIEEMPTPEVGPAPEAPAPTPEAPPATPPTPAT